MVNYLAQSQILKFSTLVRDSTFHQDGDREGSHRGPEPAAAARLRERLLAESAASVQLDGSGRGESGPEEGLKLMGDRAPEAVVLRPQ